MERNCRNASQQQFDKGRETRALLASDHLERLFIVAWDNAPSSNRIMVSLLLPGPMEADQWLHDVRTRLTSHVMANQLATDTFVRRERRRLQARHIWEKIEPN